MANRSSQAFQELAKGERTASALENNLTALERKIDELLAQADNDERNLRKDRSGADPKSHDTFNGDKDAGNA